MENVFSAEYFIETLKMEPHVEGGYCRELFKSPDQIGNRPLSSSIYYLLKSGQVSKFHRLMSDEIWFYHYGSPLLIHQIDTTGALISSRLGLAVDKGELPQILVPRGTVFGVGVVERDSFCLVSCVVSPGFDFHDFELFSNEEMMRRYPQHKEIITQLGL